MPILVLDLLKYAFLAVLYIFIARAVKAVYVELRGPVPARRVPQGAPAPAPARPPPRRSKKSARKVTVVEGEQFKGKSFEVGDELVIGRADKCDLVLDDAYVSQMHARIFTKGDGLMVEDLGSTNGTYLNRSRISGPAPLHRGDQVKIGKTVLEMRK
jgi:pSer/pThr/pTyr-binding forkhead associated (FHA) protein